MTARKTKGHASRKDVAQTTAKKKFTSKNPLPQRSMRAEAQRTFVLKSLRRGRRHTYWFRANGISHSAARVMDLNKRGYVIVSTRVNAYDSDGYEHRNVAMYELISESTQMDLFRKREGERA